MRGRGGLRGQRAGSRNPQNIVAKFARRLVAPPFVFFQRDIQHGLQLRRGVRQIIREIGAGASFSRTRFHANGSFTRDTLKGRCKVSISNSVTPTAQMSD